MNESIPEPNNLPENPKLSVCMIVRDEQVVLPRCLRSVQNVANELIVVDTGSEDRTASIAKDFGAKVFHFEWSDDFSAARNETLKYASGDWVLQIDADEELLPASIPALKNSMHRSTVLYYLITCDNGPECTGVRFHKLARLFRMHPELLYARPYHETIEENAKRIISQKPIWEVKRASNIVIRHHGYGPGEMQRKLERGRMMMETCLEKNPNDAYILGKLGGLHTELGNYADGERYLRKALKIDPDSLVTNYHLALFLQERGDVDGAIRLFRRVLERDAGFREAYNYLGVAYAEKGWIEEAIVEFEKAIAVDASFPEARNNLGVAYAQMGMTQRAKSEFKKAIDIDPHLSGAHKNLATAYFHQNHYDLAIKHCDKAVGLGFDVDPDFLQALAPHRQTKSSSFTNNQSESIKR